MTTVLVVDDSAVAGDPFIDFMAQVTRDQRRRARREQVVRIGRGDYVGQARSRIAPQSIPTGMPP